MTETTITQGTETVQVQLTKEQAEALLAQLNHTVPVTEPHDKYFVSAEFTEAPSAVIKPLLHAFHAKKKALQDAKDELEAVEEKIRELLNYAEVLVIAETGQEVWESRVTEGQVIDTPAIKKAHPDIVAKFMKTRRSRNFRPLV